MFYSTNNWQQTAERLTPEALERALKRQHRMQILEWFLRGGIAVGMVIFVLYLYAQFKMLALGKLLLYSVAAVGAVLLLIGALRRGSPSERLAAKYGDIAEISAEIRRGADHIELETCSFVMTDTYIIDKNDYVSYVPYSAIRTFGMDDGTVGMLLTQSEAVYHLVVTDGSGEQLRYRLEKKEQHLIAEAQMRIRKYAPQAIFDFR